MHSISNKTFLFENIFKDISSFRYRCVFMAVRKCMIRSRPHSVLCESVGYQHNRDERSGLSGSRQGLHQGTAAPMSTFHFDTHNIVTRLEGNGYTKQQAEVMTSCLLDIMNDCIKNIADTNASKIDQERLEMKLKTLINEVKQEMFLLEESKFAKIKEENERLKEKVKGVQKQLDEEVSKLKSSTKLDLSLEKSLAREEFALRDQRIKDNGNKIETEVAKLGTLMEKQKLDLIRYLVGSLISTTTVVLAVWRFLKM